MALIASVVVPLPAELRNFKPMILVVQFTPTTPAVLLPTAPIVPETWVPWLWSSMGSQVFVIALNPWVLAAQVTLVPPTVTVKPAGADQTLAARSGWL